MPDVFTKAKRSAVMACIRSSGNKGTEVALAKILRRHGITGWRRQTALRCKIAVGRGCKKQAVLRVKVDFVFRKERLAVFVDGCFWHGCPRHGTQPRNNRRFWEMKFSRNRARDLVVNRRLRSQDWRVLRIWEHELAKRNHARLARRLRQALA